MANRERGEVSIVVRGRSYTLALDTNAMCEAESVLSTPEKPVVFQEAYARMLVGSVLAMRAVLFGALRRHHPEIELQDVGALADAAGGLEQLALTLRRIAQGEAVPDPQDLDTLKVKREQHEHPRRAQANRGAGTGPRSTVRRVGLA